MYSNPTYDPNLISTNDGQTASDVKTVLDASPEKPLLARSYQERFFPGSTFKVVTATAGLTSGEVTETEPVYPVVQSYTPPLTNRPIYNFDRSNCGGTLFAILAAVLQLVVRADGRRAARRRPDDRGGRGGRLQRHTVRST